MTVDLDMAYTHARFADDLGLDLDFENVCNACPTSCFFAAVSYSEHSRGRISKRVRVSQHCYNYILRRFQGTKGWRGRGVNTDWTQTVSRPGRIPVAVWNPDSGDHLLLSSSRLLSHAFAS